jgi:hypothetical protein
MMYPTHDEAIRCPLHEWTKTFERFLGAQQPQRVKERAEASPIESSTGKELW